MDTAIIQERLDRLMAAMVAKGLRESSAQVTFRSGSPDPGFSLTWKKDISVTRKSWESEYEFKGFSGASMYEDADRWVAQLPGFEERRRTEFQAALGGLIDLGRENSIEVDYLNPLIETAKRLAENALTHQPEAL